ncbi:hypothetical protein PFISCL1PPCAC_15059, partial [Pristionchus fissidentatus]
DPQMMKPPLNLSIITDLVDVIEIDQMDLLEDDLKNCAKYIRDQSEKDHTHLYFHRAIDFAPQRIDSFSCAKKNDGKWSYAVKLEKTKDIFYINNQFSIFCGEDVTKRCTNPQNILACQSFESQDCKPPSFTERDGNQDAKLVCDHNRFVVESEGKEIGVTGTAKCVRRSGQLQWAIESNGQIIEITKFTCLAQRSCIDEQRVTSVCNNNDLECYPATITEEEMTCPRIFFLKHNNQSKAENAASCLPYSAKWNVSIEDGAKVGCYKDQEEWERMRKKLGIKDEDDNTLALGIGISIFILFFISIAVLITISILRFRSRNDRMTDFVLNEDEDDLEETELEDLDVPTYYSSNTTTKGTEKEIVVTNTFSNRQLHFPEVDPKLLRRKFEAKKLMHDNLALIGSRGLNSQLATEIEFYSTYEKIKFAEGMLTDLGIMASAGHFVRIYLALNGKEENFAIWNPIIDCLKMVIAAVKSIDKDVADKLRLSMNVNANFFLDKHGEIPSQCDDTGVNDMRILSLNCLLANNDTGLLRRMAAIYADKKDEIRPPLRKIAWIGAIRENPKVFDELKEVLYNEMASPTSNDENSKWGSKRENLIAALSSGGRRDKMEPVFRLMLSQSVFTPADVVIALTAMIRDFDDSQVMAKFIYTERHNLLKDKIPVDSVEYKKIFELFFHYGFASGSNESWLIKFVSSEGNFTQKEKSSLNLAGAINYGEIYENIFEDFESIERVVMGDEQ